MSCRSKKARQPGGGVRGFCFEMKPLLRTSATDETIKRKDGPLVRAIFHPFMPLAARLLRLNIRCLQTLRALLGFETHLLILRQRLEAFGANLGEVSEQVVAAAVRRDESKSLRIVEPLHSTCRHFLPLRIRLFITLHEPTGLRSVMVVARRLKVL